MHMLIATAKSLLICGSLLLLWICSHLAAIQSNRRRNIKDIES
jgi:hypothetical protein